nr:serine protease [uncultured Roseovarius sp.]
MKLIVAVAALAVAGGVAASVPPLISTSPPLADAVVKLKSGNGHGSAVHIGDGLYLTAAHVLRSSGAYHVVTNYGDTARVEVLWTADRYDIALIGADVDGVDAVDLDCRIPEFGESLQFRGNPVNLEHVSTWGRVSGAMRQLGDHWAEAVPVDGAVIPGMSGGAALDADGDLVGINVGVMAVPTGLSPSLVGVGYIVPAQTICNLMARD